MVTIDFNLEIQTENDRVASLKFKRSAKIAFDKNLKYTYLNQKQHLIFEHLYRNCEKGHRTD